MDKNTPKKVVETGDFSGEAGPTIHAVANSRELFEVYRLTYECYLAVGHGRPHPDGLWIPFPEFDHIPETIIFVAELDGKIVGSITLTRDGAHGLPSDKNFNRTSLLIRTEGRKLAEVWRLVVSGSCPDKPRILTSLMAHVTKRLLSEGIQTCLLFVQAEHVDLCRQRLNVVTLSHGKTIPGSSSASSVFMRCDVENIPKRWRSRPLMAKS